MMAEGQEMDLVADASVNRSFSALKRDYSPMLPVNKGSVTVLIDQKH